jgi:hypothetical protein
MKFAVCSLYDSNYKELGEMTVDTNGQEYCDKWGYDHIVKKEDFAIPNHLGFEKIHFLLEIMNRNEHDWLFWRGTDTVLTNYTIELSQLIHPKFDFILAQDVHGIQSDSMLIKNTERCRQFLEEVLSRKDHDPEEQFSMRNIMGRYTDIIGIIPQKFINSYDFDLYLSTEDWNIYGVQNECRPKRDLSGLNAQWSVGDFMIHFPGIKNSKRIELTKYYMTKIIK